MKVLFMGTPDFSVLCLEKIIKAGHDVCGIFTQPDKKRGRGQCFCAPPVKEVASKHNLQVFQPSNLKDGEAFKTVKSLNPDVIVVVAYGKILPEEIINYPKYGCINVHASILPKYRGAAPIQWCIINGEKTTGVTTMFMDKGLDTGDILLKAEIDIAENETAGELSERLSKLGAEIIVKTLEDLKNGTAVRVKQDDALSNYAVMLDKSLCKIDFNKSAVDVHNLVRGLNPWPTACTVLNSKPLKIHRTRILGNISGAPGEVKSTTPFVVCCKDNSAIEIIELQFDNKKKMRAEDFMRGYREKENLILG